MSLKKFSNFVSEKVVSNQIEDKPVKLSSKIELPKEKEIKKVFPNDKLEKVFKQTEPKKVEPKKESVDSILEKISFNGKIAKFPNNFLPSDSIKVLESNNISKNKLHYIITEQPNNCLLVVKYNEKAGPDMKEFINSLISVYKKNIDFKPLVEKIQVDGNNVFVMMKNIPNVQLKGKTFIKILNDDLTGLLNGLK
jgi:hypothetical protein